MAFGSSPLRQSTEEELFSVRHQLEQLQRDNRSLEEKVRWAEGRCARTLTLGKRLNEALLEEQKRSRTLAERLRRYSERSLPERDASAKNLGGSATVGGGDSSR